MKQTRSVLSLRATLLYATATKPAVLASALAIVLAAALPHTARAEEFSPPSRVTEVIVYRGMYASIPGPRFGGVPRGMPTRVVRRPIVGQALVTRVAHLSLPAGDHRILLKEIPSMTDADSIRISGAGSEGISIGGVEVRQQFREARLTDEYRAIKEELEGLTRQQTGLDDRAKSIVALREFLAGLKASAGEEGSKDLLTRGFAVESWQKAFDFLSGRLDALAGEERELRSRRVDLNKKIEVARLKLAQLASQGGTQRWTAEVLVSAARGGEIDLRATYLAGNASWTPLYDVRLNPDSGIVEIVWKAKIVQNTGEDWKDVAVTLSSTRPSAGIDLPRITSLQLGPAPRRELARKRAGAYSAEELRELEVLGRNYQEVLALTPGVSEPDADGNRPAAPVPAAIHEAAASRRDVAVNFVLPGKLDIPSDGQPHQHQIASREMEGGIEYHAIPQRIPKVYMVARVTLPGEIPILPGRVQHFVGVDLVGSSHIENRS
ncbi:MAG: mucoidy inhibitor MuiA family protein, partial [Acidobacteria bacterium]|nr:mucoidy inhibitor MuiA family protein [Acidobacteriota bacterium]